MRDQGCARSCMPVGHDRALSPSLPCLLSLSRVFLSVARCVSCMSRVSARSSRPCLALSVALTLPPLSIPFCHAHVMRAVPVRLVRSSGRGQSNLLAVALAGTTGTPQSGTGVQVNDRTNGQARAGGSLPTVTYAPNRANGQTGGRAQERTRARVGGAKPQVRGMIKRGPGICQNAVTCALCNPGATHGRRATKKRPRGDRVRKNTRFRRSRLLSRTIRANQTPPVTCAFTYPGASFEREKFPSLPSLM